MRIRHGELEGARHNPAEFIRQSAIPFKTKGPGRFQYVKNAVKVYHDQDIGVAMDYLNAAYTRRGFKEKGLDEYRGYLLTYHMRLQEQPITLVEVEDKINLSIGPEIIIGGKVGRLSITDDLILEVCLFVEHTPDDIFSQLRMPLLQHYYAQTTCFPLEQVQVGAYDFDLGRYSYISYSAKQVQQSWEEARVLGDTISRLIATDLR